ncbi:MAG: hypothetical protein KKE62_11540 [Proteobacteria bacterium]|nr:hypothetical protein [Pseudomonadota bacterium]MBU1388909.1 hypothetical protein [Pseudomonadota bacterium]MBU1543461.1 hypothetical protein [Pseudomonadota bacterium]MBU2430271.1 hypothetical protein [Pseudomonadota bacterium]MBU2480768.1 hypothetical protein [Pseudomonadota bacterium]
MSNKSMRQQFADTMLDIGQKDDQLVVLVGDISHFILQPFAKACPGRYYNIGICEPTIISMAAGLSKVKMHPVIHTIAPFLLERGFEQIKLDFCYQQLGGNIITVGSAFDYSNLGCTHHCYGDFALLKTLPRTQILYPSSTSEFDILFRQAYQNDFLTVYRLPSESHDFHFKPADIKLGKGIKIKEGNNLTIIVTGPHLKIAVAAEDSLKNSGWDTEIIYIHTIKPLDEEMVFNSIKKTKKVLVIEEHMQSGGLGDSVLRAIKDINDFQFESLAIPDMFVTGYGTYQDHCNTLGFTKDGIVSKITTSFNKES